jgi:hypothetical protein
MNRKKRKITKCISLDSCSLAPYEAIKLKFEAGLTVNLVSRIEDRLSSS